MYSSKVFDTFSSYFDRFFTSSSNLVWSSCYFYLTVSNRVKAGSRFHFKWSIYYFSFSYYFSVFSLRSGKVLLLSYKTFSYSTSFLSLSIVAEGTRLSDLVCSSWYLRLQSSSSAFSFSDLACAFRNYSEAGFYFF